MLTNLSPKFSKIRDKYYLMIVGKSPVEKREFFETTMLALEKSLHSVRKANTLNGVLKTNKAIRKVIEDKLDHLFISRLMYHEVIRFQYRLPINKY